MTKRIFLTVLLSLSPAPAKATDVMFEGYYRIDLDTKPIGYSISRYELEPKKHQFTYTSFQHAKLGDKIVEESLKATSNDKFQPISYRYAVEIDGRTKVIEATFKGDKMSTLTTEPNAPAKKAITPLAKNVFLSSFLVYRMLRNKLAPGDAFTYLAIAEEDGAVYHGSARLESAPERTGQKVFRVLNEYKSEKFTSRMAVLPDAKVPAKFVKAEVLGSESPAKNMRTELVETPALATQNQPLPNKALVALFGNLPGGKLNLVAAAASAKKVH